MIAAARSAGIAGEGGGAAFLRAEAPGAAHAYIDGHIARTLGEIAGNARIVRSRVRIKRSPLRNHCTRCSRSCERRTVGVQRIAPVVLAGGDVERPAGTGADI